MKKLLFLPFIACLFIVSSANAALAPDCTVVYGGGTKDNCVKMEGAISTAQYGNEATNGSNPTAGNMGKNQQATTKGGLPVYPAPSMSKTPATGAEMFSLLALIPAAGAGFMLRRKSK